MPVYRLPKDLIFPDPRLSNKEGLLAVGGDLSPERLLCAYSQGIFPWYGRQDPILWWSPDPRCVIFPGNIRISKSMAKFLRKNKYKITYDTVFPEVISMCMKLRKDETWLTEDMIEAYCRLHRLGFGHSVEAWFENKLVGGLYGVSLGKCFFGESMFSTMDNASKTAIISLSQELASRGFLLIDCQVYSPHLESLGAVNIPRSEFLCCLKSGLSQETIRGRWSFMGTTEYTYN